MNSVPYVSVSLSITPDGPLFSPTPFSSLSPPHQTSLLAQREEELESLQAIFGDNHIATAEDGAILITVDLNVPDSLTKGAVDADLECLRSISYHDALFTVFPAQQLTSVTLEMLFDDQSCYPECVCTVLSL